MNTLKFISPLLFIFIFFSCNANATSKTTVKVVTEEWRPFNYTDENGEVTGVATDRLRGILDSIELDYTITSKKWETSVQLARNLENTLIYTIMKTEKREPLFQWICPLIGPIKVHMYKRSHRNDIIVNKLSDAKNYTISIEKGESDHDFLLSNGFNKKLQVTQDPYEGPRKFFSGKVDLVLQTEEEMAMHLKYFKRSWEDVVKLIEVSQDHNSEGCIAFGLKTDKELVSKVREALELYNKNHSFEVIKN